MKYLYSLSTCIFFLSISLVYSQTDKSGYEKSMKAALFMHDTASAFASEQAVADLYEEIGRKYPNEWLPNYWASYIYTQLANIHGRVPDTPENIGKKELLDMAQEQLDKAKEKNKNADHLTQSDFHALQAFIHFFKLHFARSSIQPEEIINKEKEAYQENMKVSLRLNKSNPLTMVLIGTSMMSKPDVDFRDALAAKTLLEKANELFKQSDTPRALTTHWNQEWLGLFWLKNADTKFSEQLQ